MARQFKSRFVRSASARPVLTCLGAAACLAIASPALAQGPGPLCYADCDRSTGPGNLDVFDFLCFQDKFVTGDPYADCDGSGSLDIFDFLCFQDAFIQGCPAFRINPPGTDPSQCEEATTSSQCREIGMPEPLMSSVHLFSGEFHTTVEDMRIRGRGFDFVWQRTYRSFAGPANSPMGDRWDHSYNIYLEASGGDLVLHNGKARADTYELQPGGTWTHPEFFREIRPATGGGYELVLPDMGVWTFHGLGGPTSGRIERITDRNANAMTFEYDGQGRLVTIADTLDQPAHPRRMTIGYNAQGRIEFVRDFTGREVRYAYYQMGDPGGEEGQLRSVRSPIVTGVSHGWGGDDNNFPNGKTTAYAYEPRVGNELGKLQSITDPKGQRYLVNSYDAGSGRLVRQQLGEPGDAFNIAYDAVSSTAANGFAVMRATVNDRRGHVSEAFYDELNRCTIQREYTGRWSPDAPVPDPSSPTFPKVRPIDPDFYETRWEYNDNALPTRVVYPNLNEARFEYDDQNAAPMSRGNMLTHRAVAGPLGGDQAEIVQTYEYLTAFGGCCGTQFVTRHVDGRGHETVHQYDASGNRTRTIHRDPATVEDWTYNQWGQVTSNTHPDNGSGHRRRDEFSYFPIGHDRYGYLERQVVDAAGEALTTTYEPSLRGVPTFITDPRGRTQWHSVNALDQTVEVWLRRIDHLPPPAQLHSHVIAFYYDANDNISRIDRLNRDEIGVVQPNSWITTAYQRDILDRIVARTEEVDETTDIVTRYEYDAGGNETRVLSGEATRPGGDPFNTVQYVYDERDLLYREIRAPGFAGQSSDQYDYDGNGNIIAVRTGLENQPRATVFLYDGYDREVMREDGMGNVTEYHYDANGNLGGDASPGQPHPFAQRTMGELEDAPGGAGNVRLAEIMYTYDAMDRPVRSDVGYFDPATQAPYPGGQGAGRSTTTWTYAPTSQALTRTDDRLSITTYQYDTVSRLQRITDHAGNRVDFTYDENSNVTVLTERDLSQWTGGTQTFVTRFEYDGVDRRVSLEDSAGNLTRYFYDSRDNLIRIVDPIEHETRYDYDGLDRRIATHREEGIDLTQTWDHASRLVSQTDDNGNTTEYRYDALDRRTRILNADCTEHSTQYDVHDNPVRTIDENGTVWSSQYDLLNRVTRNEVETFAPGVDTSATFETFAYDGLGRVVSAEDDDSMVMRSYDSMSNVRFEGLYIGRPFTNGFATFSTYDGVGNKLTCQYPGGRQVTRSYDPLNRPEIISDFGRQIASFDYVGPGRVHRRVNGNGTATEYTYDGLQGVPNDPNDFGVKQIVRTRHTGPAGEIDHQTYFYDPLGNLQQRRDVRAGGPQLQRNYTYDSAYRLTAAYINSPSGPTRDIEYLLDGAGNRLEAYGWPDPGSYTMNAASCEPGDAQMNQYTSTPNDTRTYDACGNLKSIDDGFAVENLTFDFRHRLTGFSGPGGISGQYTYDPFGRRITRDATDHFGMTQSVQYCYDNWHVIEEFDAHGFSIASNVYGWPCPDILVCRTLGPANYYYHQTALGHTAAVSDPFGNPVERYDYFEFGQPQIFDGEGVQLEYSMIGNPILFAGRRLDTESGLYYNRHRYYDPSAGRFISRDPLGTWADHANVGCGTAYTGNNPLSLTDPSGLLTLRLGVTLGLGGGNGNSGGGGTIEVGITIQLGGNKGKGSWLDVGLYQSSGAGSCKGVDVSISAKGGAQSGSIDDLGGLGNSDGVDIDTSDSGEIGGSVSVGPGFSLNTHGHRTKTSTCSLGGFFRGVGDFAYWAYYGSPPQTEPAHVTRERNRRVDAKIRAERERKRREKYEKENAWSAGLLDAVGRDALRQQARDYRREQRTTPGGRVRGPCDDD